MHELEVVIMEFCTNNAGGLAIGLMPDEIP
jgi:hypothetical protein